MGIHTEAVQKLYVAYFNRPADAAGLTFWESIVTAANGNTSAVSAAFAGSTEYKETYAGMSAYARIDAVYMNLFGRHAEPDGLKFWGQALISGASTIDAIVTTVAQAAQGDDKVVYANKVTAATAFSNALDTSDEMINYSGDAANAAAKAFLSGVTTDATLAAAIDPAALDTSVAAVVAAGTPPPVVVSKELTTGVDKFVGGAANDIFNAADTGWTALDSIDGGAGDNVFNVTKTGTMTQAPVGATVKNITTMNLTGGADVTADVSTYGVANLNVTAGGATDIKAAATTNVTEMNSTFASTITGGKDVTVNHRTGGNVTVNGASGAVKVTSKAGNVVITDAAGDVVVAAKGTINASGKTFTGSALDTVSYADQVAHQDAANAAASALSAANVALAAASGKVTALTTMAGTIATALDVATNNGATLTAYKAGTITQAQKVAIDAAFAAALAAPAGNLAAQQAAAQAAALAVETPIITAANAAKASATATVASATAVDAAAAQVVADDGLNASSAIAINNITSKILTTATVDGNYNGSVAITDATTLKTVLTTVNLSNAGGATLIGNAIANVSLKDYFGAVDVQNNTVGHSLTLKLDNAGAGVTDLVVDKLTVNTVSDSSIDLSAGAATAVTLTGAGALTIGSSSTFGTAAAINAAAATGNISLSVAAGQSYVGGSGRDTVTAGTAVQTATVDGGAGTADKLILTGDANFGTTAAAAKFLNFETLQLNTGVTADVTKFTGSTITGVALNGGVKVSGLSAAQAGNVTVMRNGTYEIGVAGASTVGQLDTVKMIVSDGSAARNTITLTTPTLTGVEVLNLVATDNIVIGSLANATALTNINIEGAGTTNITTGALALNVNTVIDGHLATRGVTVDASLSTANGLKIVGSATATNTLTGNALSSVLIGGSGNDTLTGGLKSDTITSGNGNNTISSGIVDAANIGGDTVTVGNGANTITLNGSGNATVTAGNGYNTITTNAGADKITVGTGGNVITAGAGGDIITFGAHVAGVIDTINYTAAGQTFAAATSPTSGVTPLTGVDVIKGMHAGDLISMYALATVTASTVVNTSLLSLSATSTANAIAIVRGNFDATSSVFTASATGADSMVQWDADGIAGGANSINDIILVGFTGTLVTGTDVLTLA